MQSDFKALFRHPNGTSNMALQMNTTLTCPQFNSTPRVLIECVLFQALAQQ